MKLYSPIGKCIYCGSLVNLSSEHIVPFSLQGMHQLPDASCDRCAEYTKAFEGRVAKMLSRFRQTENIKTRNPKNRKKTVLFRTSGGGSIEVPNDGVSGLLPTIKFRFPGFHRPNDYEVSERKKWVGVTLGMLPYRGPKDMSIWKNLPVDSYSYESQPFDVESYALLMAKIAHCTAVGTFGVDNFQHFLPPFILGKKEISFPIGANVESSANRYWIIIRKILRLLRTKFTDFDLVCLHRNLSTVDLAFFVGSIEEIKPLSVQSYYDLHVELQPVGKLGYIVCVGIRLFPTLGGPMAFVVTGWVDRSNYQKVMDYKNEEIGFRHRKS